MIYLQELIPTHLQTFMSDLKRKWNRISEEKRQSSIDELIYYFEQERNEKIGVIAAEQLLDFFLQNVVAEVYNRGLSDAKKLTEKRIEDLQFDMDDLMDL